MCKTRGVQARKKQESDDKKESGESGEEKKWGYWNQYGCGQPQIVDLKKQKHVVQPQKPWGDMFNI